MTELLTAAQMRAIEEAAITSGEVTGLELMERAGRGVVEAIFEEWPELRETSHRAVVLCGPGNNGGDGFVVARLLKEWGWEVEVFLYGDPDKLPPDARVNYERWRELGEVLPVSDYQDAESWGCDLLVDALFGTGLRRPIDELGHLLWNIDDAMDVNPTAELMPERPSWFAPIVVAVDLPSGICADSGEVIGGHQIGRRGAASAHLTVTFHKQKPGHLLSVGPSHCGKVVAKDIGLGLTFKRKYREALADLYGIPVSQVAKGTTALLHKLSFLIQWPVVDPDSIRKGAAHKYTHGHALILSGGAGKGGAARLAARGALRIGAGLVTVGCPPDALTENAARLDAVMLKPLADADAFARVLEDSRINALLLGPGLGTGEREVALVAAALGCRSEPRPTGGAEQNGVGRGSPRLVLDADALTILAREPNLLATLHENCVLTPHAGEFARLFPDIAEKLAAPATKGPAYSKVDATREAAKRAGCVVLFKGPDTVIADPTGRCSINSAHYDRAAPWLATAGSGDVLAGFITGLLARGFAPIQAAETAAWLHVECALKFGPGLIAEDLPEQLPAVFRDLGL